MPTLLQIAQLGQPVLRQKSKPVRDIEKKAIQQLIEDLTATLMDVHGVGLSASQVYQPIRLFILASHPNPRYPKAPHMSPLALINPKIISHGKDIAKDWEGCLSIPGIRGFVPRSTLIEVEYTNQNGKIEKKTFTDFIARIFQHEFDHLEGILFIDRVKSTDLISEKEYQKRIVARH